MSWFDAEPAQLNEVQDSDFRLTFTYPGTTVIGWNLEEDLMRQANDLVCFL